MSGLLPDLHAWDFNSLYTLCTHISGMKVVALVAGLLVGGSYIDSHYYHGYYFRAALSLVQQIATHTGLRR